MDKRITGIESIRIRNKVVRDEIMNCCGLTELEYNNLLFESGLEFIKTHISPDDTTMRIVSSNAYYWKWFKNQWFIRENDFLADNVLFVLRCDGEDKKYLHYNWLKLHRVDLMKVYPQGREWDLILNEIFKANND